MDFTMNLLEILCVRGTEKQVLFSGHAPRLPMPVLHYGHRSPALLPGMPVLHYGINPHWSTGIGAPYKVLNTEHIRREHVSGWVGSAETHTPARRSKNSQPKSTAYERAPRLATFRVSPSHQGVPKIRTPRSSTRPGDATFVRLIERIRPSEWHPMAIEGPTMKCGIEIEEARLWPAAHFPRVPLLLEFAGIATPGWGHKRSSHTYVLWQYRKGSFVELVRSVAFGNEWLEAIRAPALNALRDPAITAARRAAEAAKRLHAAVDNELSYLDFEGRGHLVSRLYEDAACRLAHLD